MSDFGKEDVTVVEQSVDSKDLGGAEPVTGSVAESTPDLRIRTLTEKGKEAYLERKEKYVQDLELLWTICEAMVQDTTTPPEEEIKRLELEQSIVQAYTRYGKYRDEYRQYLTAQRTEISNRDLEDFTAISDIRKQLFDAVITKLRSTGQVPKPTRSTKSHKSGSKATSRTGSTSTKSSTSSLAKRSRAKAEALKASIRFAEQQMAIEKQQAEYKERAIREEAELKGKEAELKARIAREEAELNAEKTFLELQKETAAAEAEARAYEQSNHGDSVSELPSETEDPKQRVLEYVNQQADEVQNSALNEEKGDFPVATTEQVEIPNSAINVVSGFYPVSTIQLENQNIPAIQTGPKNFDSTVRFDQNITSTVQSLNYGLPSVTSTPFQPKHETKTSYPVASTLNRDAPVFIPSISKQSSQIDHQPAGEITKFLLRKDLLFSRLTNYDDRPETYYAWKASFKCITEELSVTDSEQIDLMVKWLSPESSKQARSIRACNAENPSKGLTLLWKRLDDRYGSPEMMEASLKKKLENFPKLSNKDHKRLYELSDILSEIQSIKVKPKFQNLLAYFDSSAGVKPVVAKLPYGLQEKWTTRAARYKTQHDVAFPPFTEFCAFIEEMSQIKNDPGFCIEQEPYQKPKGTATRTNYNTNPRVNVRKTEVDKRKLVTE